MPSIKSFYDEQSRLIAATVESAAAFKARNTTVQQVKERSQSRLSAAEITQSNETEWAGEQLVAMRELVEEGRLKAREVIDVDQALPLTAPAGTIGNRPGLELALKSARAALRDIEDSVSSLISWQRRRSAILRASVILLLILLAIGAGIIFLPRAYQTVTALATATRAAMLAQSATGTSEARVTATRMTTTATAPIRAAAAAEQTVTVGATSTTNAQLASSTLEDGEESEPESIEAEARPTNQPTAATEAEPEPAPFPTSDVCAGAFPTRLAVGDTARVINYQLNVRAGPSTGNEIVRRLDVGRTMEILEGPVCDDGQLWYRIRSELITPRDGSPAYQAEGWLVEETGSRYYLEPVP